MRMLITGGAGFVGGSLARSFLREGHDVILFDNLRRRGSELNLAALTAEGARFVHGDVRTPADLDALDGSFDVLIEASAEPSVHAGMSDSPRYVLDTNLGGAMNCLEFARTRCGALVFLSSSRVYSIEALRSLPLEELPTRLDFADGGRPRPVGASADGIAENFESGGPRSYYGASDDRAVDVPWYITDHSKVSKLLGWAPLRRPRRIVEDLAAWIAQNAKALEDLVV